MWYVHHSYQVVGPVCGNVDCYVTIFIAGKTYDMQSLTIAKFKVNIAALVVVKLSDKPLLAIS